MPRIIESPDRDAIQQAVETVLRSRRETLCLGKGKRARDDQAAFLAGAMAALHAVYSPNDTERLTDMAPPAWVFSCFRGDLL